MPHTQVHPSEGLALALLALRSLAAAAPDRPVARQAMRALAALGTGLRLQASLADCLAGRATLVAEGNGFFLVDAAPCARQAVAAQVIGPLCRAASAWFAAATPSLLIDLRQGQGGISHCVHAIEGLGHIVVCGQTTVAELPAVLAHELAHGHFRSGNRFLDEGLAVHFELSQVPHHNFPASASDLPGLLSAAPALTPLRLLLQAHAGSDLLLRGASASPDTALAYAQACRLIEHWTTRLGRARMLAACRAIGSAPADRRDAVCLQATGLSIDDTDIAVFGPPRRVRAALRRPGAAAGGDLQHRHARARALLQDMLAHGPALANDPRTDARLAEVDALLDGPCAGEEVPGRDLLLAWRHTVALLMHRGRPSGFPLLQAAIRQYDAALAAAPDDPEVLQAAGCFFEAVPSTVGGRPDFARRCLARAQALRAADAAAAVGPVVGGLQEEPS